MASKSASVIVIIVTFAQLILLGSLLVVAICQFHTTWIFITVWPASIALCTFVFVPTYRD